MRDGFVAYPVPKIEFDINNTHVSVHYDDLNAVLNKLRHERYLRELPVAKPVDTPPEQIPALDGSTWMQVKSVDGIVHISMNESELKLDLRQEVALFNILKERNRAHLKSCDSKDGYGPKGRKEVKNGNS